MDKLEIKKVNFMGDELVAVRDNDSGKIHVAVKWICDGLGFTKNQADAQVSKIQKDALLFNRANKYPLDTNGIINDVLCLELDFLPAWLFKINANYIKDEQIKNKLITYQIKCKDILADAFLQTNDKLSIDNYSIPRNMPDALRLAANLAEKIEELAPKAEKYDKFLEATNAQTWLETAKVLGTGRTRLCKFLKQQEIIMDNCLPYQIFLDKHFFITRELTAYDGIQAFNYVQTLVTPKGISFISDLLKGGNEVAVC